MREPIGVQRRDIWLAELVAVPAVELGVPIGSLAAHYDALKHALDILIDGV